jgi:hypothetical protein
VPPLLADFGAGRDLALGAGLDFGPTFLAGADAAAFFLASITFFLGKIFFLGVATATFLTGVGAAFLAGVGVATFLGFLA